MGSLLCKKKRLTITLEVIVSMLKASQTEFAQLIGFSVQFNERNKQ